MNKQIAYSVGLATIIITAFLLLLGKPIFGMTMETNLFQTGITPGGILGIANIVIAFWIYKKWL